MKSICIIIPTLRHGGMERVVTELANYAVTTNNFKITIICLIKMDDYYVLDKKVTVIKPSFQYKKGVANKIRSLFFLIRELIRLKPDTVLGFSEPINPLTVIASKLTFNNVFISDRCSPSAYLNSNTHLFRRILYPFANGIIAQTNVAKEVMLKYRLNKNITVIPNPLREINDKHPKETNKTIITASRLAAGKNVDHIIDVFSSLKKANDWKLVILGDGPERKKLEDQIIKLKLTDRVVLKGAVRDVDKHFAMSSIFTFASSSEGFPNALSEAMAFPLACISYDCLAGPADIIKHKHNGVLVPVNDKKIFLDELQTLIDNKQLIKKYRDNALLNRARFSSANTSDKYLKFITCKK